MQSVSEDGKSTTFGDFVWRTYEECAEMRDCVGSAITHLNLAPANPDDGVSSCIVTGHCTVLVIV